MKGFACALCALMVATSLTVSQAAVAQGRYPNKPITMIIGWNAGAQADVLLRVLSQEMSKELEQPMIVVSLVRDGRLRVLMSLDDKRWDVAPNAPTIIESGYDFSAYSKACIHGPKGMPEPIRARLEAAAAKVIQDPTSAYSERAKTMGVSVTYINGKTYTKAVQDRTEGFRSIINTLGLK